MTDVTGAARRSVSGKPACAVFLCALGVSEWEKRTISALMTQAGCSHILLYVMPAARADAGRSGAYVSHLFRRIGIYPSLEKTEPVTEDIFHQLFEGNAGTWSLRRVDRIDKEFLMGVDDAHPEFILDLTETGRMGGESHDLKTLIWRFDFGQNGGPIAFSEFTGKRCLIHVYLKAVDISTGRESVLKSGTFGVYRHSYARTVDEILKSICQWPARFHRALCKAPENDFTGASLQPGAYKAQPDWRESTRVARSQFGEVARKAFEAVTRHTNWNIGVVGLNGNGDSDSADDVIWLAQDDAHVSADPFISVRDEGIFIVYERLDYRRHEKNIHWMKIDQSASVIARGFADGLPDYTSYPFLLEEAGDVYCIPEAHKTREIAIFIAESFPDRWRKLKTLVHGIEALDSTVFRYENRWWLFFTDKSDGPNHNLQLWHSDSLFGRWESHRCNPVKTDVRSARPAGNIYLDSGRLLRPSQNCSEKYGGSIVLNEIVTLNTEEYAERFYTELKPAAQSPYQDGLHTLSRSGGLRVVDGRRVKFIPSRLFGRIFSHGIH